MAPGLTNIIPHTDANSTRWGSLRILCTFKIPDYMYIEQLYTNCLAHAAYYIEDNGEAAVVDPLRNPAPYMELAKRRGATIKYVLESHFHADFVSGHIDLANKTGATIVFGPDATPGYKAYIAKDGERLHLGKATIEILHTPGHTIESTCYLVHDETGKADSIFTGDTLFIGDVGRPDLLSGNLAKEQLATIMFDSLQKKIKPLDDNIVVYPGHGAGSACGKNIGKESQSTIGHEKKFNYALRIDDRQKFIEAVTTGQPAIPAYFFKDAVLNKTGSPDYDQVLQRSLKPLSPDELTQMQMEGALVLDTRDPLIFPAGFVPGAINIGLGGDFAVWAGTLISPDTPLLLIADNGREHEAIERLARVGYDKVQGYLDGGMPNWFRAQKPFDKILSIDGAAIRSLLDDEAYELLDVRNRREVAKDHIAGSVHIPLNQLGEMFGGLDKDKKWLIYCAGGYRSMIAASYLKSKGFHFVASVEGGMANIRKNAPELVELGQETE